MAKRKAAKKKTAKKTAKKKASVRKESKTHGQSGPADANRASETPEVVYVHGIGEHPSPDETKRQWDLATFGQGMGSKTEMAYWADLRDQQRRRTRNASDDGDELDLKSLVKSTGIDSKNKDAVEFARALAEAVAGPQGEQEPRKKGVRKKILPLPRFIRRPIAAAFLRWFVRDTARYFFDERFRKAVKNKLRDAIAKTDEPFILVAHSQGSIAAFEVLTELSKRPDVSLFVTIGSPLGIQEVQDLLTERGVALQVPPEVRAWHNFADRLDPVAIDAHLDSDFEPRERKSQDGSVTHEPVRIHDHMVVNERTKDLLRFNPHSSAGYLTHPDVRSIIHHAMGFDSGGRFVVARDVAEGFIAPERRQPVLIEVLHPEYPALGEEGEPTVTRQREHEQNTNSAALKTLEGRIQHLKQEIQNEVVKRAKKRGIAKQEAETEARVCALRKYVAARLTADEIDWLADGHASLNVYAVWRSAQKKKLLTRSHGPIKVDAARASYKAIGNDIVWAVLDTGARRDHPHFAAHGTVLEVLDCTANSDTPDAIVYDADTDVDGHGTHVSGIIAGEGQAKGTPYQGIANRTKLRVYKVLDDDGYGEDAWIIKALDHIFRMNNEGTGLHLHGINLSLGGPFDASVYGC